MKHLLMDLPPLSTPFGDPHDPIIILDDDPDDAFQLRRILQGANIHHPAVTFFNARRAIEYLTYLLRETPAFRPCLLLADLHMRPVDGFEFIAWVRKQRLFKKIPVIAFSGWELPSDAEKAIAAGANLCVEKFPKPDALRRLLLESPG